VPFVYSPGCVPSLVLAKYHLAESIAAVKVVVTGGGVFVPVFLQEYIKIAIDNPNATVRIRYLN